MYKLFITSDIPKDKAATFGYRLFESEKIDDVVDIVNNNAIIPCFVKDGHRLRANVLEIFNWIRLDVDKKGEAEKIDKALKDVFHIKKPSTSHAKNPWKWHYIIPIENVSQNYDGYKLQYAAFLAEFGIELSDKSLASVVQNTNPMGEAGIKLTTVNRGKYVWKAPDVKPPKRKELKEKHSDVSKADIKKVLTKIDPDCGYEDWLQVGFALYDWCPKKGLKLFDKWSQGSDKYDGTTVDKWDDFQKNASGDVTVGTLMHMAYGEKQDPVEAFGKEEGNVRNLSKKEKKAKKKEPKETPRFDKYGLDHVVINRIKSEVMRVKGGFELLNKNGKWIFVLEKEFWSVVPKTFGNPFNHGAIQDMKDQLAKFSETKENEDGGIEKVVKSTKKTAKKVEDLTTDIEVMEDIFKDTRKDITNHITAFNQYDTRKIEIDPFRDTDEVKMVGDTVSVTLCNIFYNMSISEPGWDTKPFLEDFREHFSHFDEFMGLLIASRFSSNRKKAYLHTKMVSDFGKSFLGGIFKRLGLLVEMEMGEMKKAVRGEPSGVNPKDFITAWILQLDEVKYIPAELKKIYNEITIAAKGQQRMEVPTYMKWLSSAEDISGMKGVGADEQFANRMSAWDMGTKTLTGRKMFKKEGGAKYFTSLKWEIYEIIRKAVEKHVAMGKAEAYKVSEEYIDEFHSKYKIEAGLNDTLEEFTNEIHERLVKVAKGRNRDTWVGVDKLIASDFMMLEGKLVALRVGKMSNIYALLAKEHYGEDHKALLYKSNLIRDMFEEDRVKYKRGYIYLLKAK